MGTSVGTAVGKGVGRGDGTGVGASVGSAVGKGVGWAVGSGVGACVGVGVGRRVGIGSARTSAEAKPAKMARSRVVSPPPSLILTTHPPTVVRPGARAVRVTEATATDPVALQRLAGLRPQDPTICTWPECVGEKGPRG